MGQYTIRENIRPDWLITQDGTRLELDFYVEELNIAIEVQGTQHYIYTPHFHQNYSGFKNQLERDKVKRQICQQHNIELIEVDTYDEAHDIILKLSDADYSTPMHLNALKQFQQNAYINIPNNKMTGFPRTIRKHLKQIRRIVIKADERPLSRKERAKINFHLRAIEQYRTAKGIGSARTRPEH